MKKLTFALLFVALAIPLSDVRAQEPDRRGEIWSKSATHEGVRASAPIPPHMHMRNEGGSDGAGLCVICSIIINGRYQGVPGLEGGKNSALWKAAKNAPGGYSPDKLARLLRQVMPDEKYASYLGTGSAKDRAVLEKLSKAGYPIGATMNTGRTYNYMPIHHMVSLIHYRMGGWACFVDNNKPGTYSWIPADEWDRRWPDMGMAWAWIWTRLPVIATFGLSTLALVLLAVGIFIVAESFAEPD